MIVLIPALDPGPALPRLVADLRAADATLPVWIVDDGSAASAAPVFTAATDAGARILRHPRNLGKGAALKTGFAEALRTHPGHGVVTADADGQHAVTDILRVVAALRHDQEDAASAPGVTTSLILGCRGFTGQVPLRSRVGNALARGVFRLAAGWSLSDTQTGLRGIPASVLAWAAAVPGDRFEYEQNVLLCSRDAGIRVREIPIATVYLDDNASSHFRPVRDSIRVAMPLLRYTTSSVAAFVIDTVALLVLTALTGSLVLAVILARLLSASVNFAVNRTLVFRAHSGALRPQLARYAALAVGLLLANLVLLQALDGLGMPLLAAKVVTEAALFVCGFLIQRAVVFRRELLGAPYGGHRNRIATTTRMESDASTPGRLP